MRQNKGKSVFLAKRYRIYLPVLYLVCLVVLLLVGTYLMFSHYTNCTDNVEKRAIQQMEASVAFLDVDNIKALTGVKEDYETTAYKNLEEGLIRMCKLDEKLRFIYIYRQVDDHLIFLVESENPDSPDHSPPGQIYSDASSTHKKVFTERKAAVSKPYKDRWGKWVSVILPLKDPVSGQVIAALGADFYGDWWMAEQKKHLISLSFILLSMLLVLISVGLLIKSNHSLVRLNRRLQKSRQMFQALYEQAPFGIAIGESDKPFMNTNLRYRQIVDRSVEELENMDWTAYTHPDDIRVDEEMFNRFKAGENNGYRLEKRVIRPDGSVIWVKMTTALLEFSNRKIRHHLCMLQDITERKAIEEKLAESERAKAEFLSHLPGMAYRSQADAEGQMEYVSDGCLSLTGYLPEQFMGGDIDYNDLILAEFRTGVHQQREKAVTFGSKIHIEYCIKTAYGDTKWVVETGRSIRDENEERIEALEGIIIDISEQKKREEEVHFLHEHDILTGLFDRHHFDEIRQKWNDCEAKLPLTIFVCDIDGVSLINDALGHDAGDRLIIDTAKLLSRVCRKNDMLARISGDEFKILLPNTGPEERQVFSKNLQELIDEYNNSVQTDVQKLSLSFGMATKVDMTENISEVEKTAIADMKRQKLINRRNFHRSTISAIMETVYAKSQETEEHAKRLGDEFEKIGQALNLSEESMSDLQLLASLHDIGKVGIEERILNKPGKLTPAEWSIMKRHPEIGYRIVMSSPELAQIAPYILHYHERWDGAGYPEGLAGEEIPLLSRILAVVDAFDVMTEDRVYRKAISPQAAARELHRCSGSQFDANIVDVYLRQVLRIQPDKLQ